jgi:integrase
MDLVQRALVWEATEPDVYINVFFGFPFADVPDVGMTLQVLTNANPELAGKISPHTLRHTAATWLMQIGVSTWEAAGFLGMSEKTLRDVYGHHHPDYLHRAANAIGTKKPVSLVNSLVGPQRRRLQPSQSVENIGGPGRCATRSIISMR